MLIRLINKRKLDNEDRKIRAYFKNRIKLANKIDKLTENTYLGKTLKFRNVFLLLASNQNCLTKSVLKMHKVILGSMWNYGCTMSS